MAIFARNSKLINKRRFSENILSESFGGEIPSEERGESLLHIQEFANLLEFGDRDGRSQDGRNTAQLPKTAF
jgi:hypothetical protein